MSQALAVPGNDDDEVFKLVANGQEITGWQAFRLTRGCDRVPMDFDCSFTDHYPGENQIVTIRPGDPCQAKLGEDVVLTGFVDQYIQDVSANRHILRITGRSKVEDIVDSSAEYPGNYLSGPISVVEIAKKLCAFQDIKVVAKVSSDVTIPFIALTLGETIFEIIELMTRYNGLLVYDNEDGDLVISDVGKESMSSGFALGVNVQEAQVILSMNERYHYYVPHFMSVFAANSQPGAAAGNTFDAEIDNDPGTRKRKLVVVSEQYIYNNAQFFAPLRAKWERARRVGRSQVVRLVCDSWRDSAGKLWQPNYMVSIDLPNLKLPANQWVISQVSFMRDEARGARAAEIILMPPSAFTPAPVVLIPLHGDIMNAILQGHQSTGGAGTG